MAHPFSVKRICRLPAFLYNRILLIVPAQTLYHSIETHSFNRASLRICLPSSLHLPSVALDSPMHRPCFTLLLLIETQLFPHGQPTFTSPPITTEPLVAITLIIPDSVDARRVVMAFVNRQNALVNI